LKFKNIESLPGSAEPQDIYEPHMPGVDVLSNMGEFFSEVRKMLDSKDPQAFIKESEFHQFIHKDCMEERFENEQRYVAIITPGRMVILFPAPSPNTKSGEQLVPIKKILPGEAPLQISVISYTKLQPYLQDETKQKCIPFLGFLAAFAYLGHNVIVFEGHSSVLEMGISHSDVLFIDSGMLPFLQDDWADVAFRVMKPNPKIFIHNRINFNLLPVVRKSSPPGWRYSEPDGEASYANVLLTAMAKARDTTKTIRIVVGLPLPNPVELASNADELEYLSTLPFDYRKLNADLIIKIIWDRGKANLMEKLQSTKSFKAIIAEAEGDSARYFL
jgi:hypothetical protein